MMNIDNYQEYGEKYQSFLFKLGSEPAVSNEVEEDNFLPAPSFCTLVGRTAEQFGTSETSEIRGLFPNTIKMSPLFFFFLNHMKSLYRIRIRGDLQKSLPQDEGKENEN